MNGNVALITGASRGIGRATAIQLANDGLTVIINYRRDTDAAAETLRRIEASGGHGLFRQFDVANHQEVDVAVKELTGELGLIDVLVNNAAVNRDKSLLRVKPKDWDITMGVNLAGMHHCTQAVVKTWVGKRCGSRIVNIGSIGGDRGFGDSTAYCASKAGVIGYTKALARELARKGVTVNVVSPGFVLTDGTAHMDLERYIQQTPLGRAGTPEEVAHLVAFLVSEHAAYITGQVICINGGMYM
jgi:3-oxoacyl-[acyl-carrier protein] reductase